jgi:DNA-binding SARP family transcriptional activator
VAGTLWSESDETHAFASLRSALSRVNKLGHELIKSSRDLIHITTELQIDFGLARGLALRIVEGGIEDYDLVRASITALSSDLLPGWYDDWLILEAEEWRQLRLHALEALSAAFIERTRFPEAVAAAIAAVKGDSLRESARRALVIAHLGENNVSEAVREIEKYRALVHEHFGFEPSDQFLRLVEDAKYCDDRRTARNSCQS